MQLQNAAENNYGNFALMLTVELATEGRPLATRELAGLQLKNLLRAEVRDILFLYSFLFHLHKN
jgi:hypothetical protein